MIRRSIFWVVGFALGCQGQIALGWQEFMAGLGQERAGAIRVEAIAALPDSLGVAGPFCGVVDQSLIVAGGANFPAGMPWEGGAKIWHTAIYRLDEPQGTWEQVGELPRPLGYGVSISIPEGLLLIGGSDANQHFAEVTLLQINDGRCVFRELKPLPIPLANSSGVLAGNHVFVVGGSDQPGEQSASSRVFSLDLGPSTNRTLDAEWVEQRSLPGRGRIFPGIACLDDELFLPSLALATVAGINIYVSIAVVGALCVGYTMFGGMKAVIWTDAMQAIVLLGGAVVAIFVLLWQVPGGVLFSWFSVAGVGVCVVVDYAVSCCWPTKPNRDHLTIFSLHRQKLVKTSAITHEPSRATD